MGVACGDLDGDGRLDLAVTNFYGESTTFYQNLGRRPVRRSHLGRSAWPRQAGYLLGFGVAFLDANNDGRLDLLTANGHVSDFSARCSPTPCLPSSSWAVQRRTADRGHGRGRSAVPAALRGTRAAVGDLDNDGRPRCRDGHAERNPG